MKLWIAALWLTATLGAQTDARITGRVHDGRTALRGEVLAIVNGGSLRIYRVPTDEQGRFTIDLGAGPVLLVAKADGYVSEERQLVVRSGRGNPALEFALQTAGSVSGRVFDENGAGVSGARVWVTYPGEARLWRLGEESGGEMTDSFGYFHLPAVAQGRSFVLHTECEGWLMSSSDNLVMHAREMPGVALMLGRKGTTIRIRVIDSMGNGVEGAEVRLRAIPANSEFTADQRASVAFARMTNKDATSAAGGYYTFAGVPSGEIVVTARAGSRRASRGGTTANGRDTDVTLTLH